MNRKKRYLLRLHFWRVDNIIFVILSTLSVLMWIVSCFWSCAKFDNVVSFLLSAILPSTLIPLGLNWGKFIYQKKQVKSTCIAIIDLSLVLIGKLNEHLIKHRNSMLNNTNKLDKEFLKVQNFDKFETLIDLFVLIPSKLSNITKLDFVDTEDSFEYALTKTSASITKAFKNNDYYSLYEKLGVIFKILGTIKPAFGMNNYINLLNKKLHDLNENIKANNYKWTDEYIVKCLETDRSESIERHND